MYPEGNSPSQERRDADGCEWQEIERERQKIRDEARMNIHRVRTKSPDGLEYVWNPGGEEHWRALQKVVDQLAKLYQIDDRTGLENALDTAALIYHHSFDALRKTDVEHLLTCVRTARDALKGEEIRQSVAGLLTDRYSGLIYGRALDEQHERRAVAVRLRLEQISNDLSDLERALERALPKLSPTKTANMRLLALVAHLKRYWKTLDGKAGTFTASHRSSRFIKSVVTFIDPNAVSKLPSAMRHRLTRS